jgi:hypothetical protein
MISLQKYHASKSTTFQPTREDIRQACKKIQATWSAQERAKRYRGSCEAWGMPPSFPLSSLLQAIREERLDRLP